MRRSLWRAFAVAAITVVITILWPGAGHPVTAHADGNTPLSYHGGPVITTPKVYIDFWGPEWSNGFNDAGYSAQQVMSYVTTYFQNVGGSDWLSTVTQYWQNPSGTTTYITNPANQLKGVPWIDSRAVPSTFNKLDVGTEASAYAIPHFGDAGDYNAVYFILTGPNKAPTDLGSNCGYHDFTIYSNHHYAYAYIPYQPTTPRCFVGQVNAYLDSFGHGRFDGFSITGGHEYAEAITDPDVRSIGTQSGWWDNLYCPNGGSCAPWDLTNDEIGDKCGFPSSSSVVEHPTFGDVLLGNQYFAAEGLWSNATGSCTLGRYYNPSAPCSSMGSSAAPPSPSLIGTTVTIFGYAYSCPIPVYQFWVLPPGSGTWQLVQPYSTSNRFVWSTAGLAPGTYNFSIWGRDAASSGTSGNSMGSWDTYAGFTYVLPAPPTGLLIAENSAYTWVAHGTRLEKFDLGGFGANIFSTSTSGTTGPHALGYFDMGANITALAVNETYLYIGLSTGRVIKTTMCDRGYNPCAFSDNMGSVSLANYTYWIGTQDYSLGAVSAIAVDSNYLYVSMGTRTVKTTLCGGSSGMCGVSTNGTYAVSSGSFYGYQDWAAPVVAQAANDQVVFTSLWGNGLTRVCKSTLGGTGANIFALSDGTCRGPYPGYSYWIGYQDLSTGAIGLAADNSHVYWSLANTSRLVQTNMCGTGGNVCAFSDGYGSGSLSGYHYWVGTQDLCSGYLAGSVASSMGLSSYVDWAFSVGGSTTRIMQATPGTGGNMFATGDCTGTTNLAGWSYWVGYQDLTI